MLPPQSRLRVDATRLPYYCLLNGPRISPTAELGVAHYATKTSRNRDARGTSDGQWQPRLGSPLWRAVVLMTDHVAAPIDVRDVLACDAYAHPQPVSDAR